MYRTRFFVSGEWYITHPASLEFWMVLLCDAIIVGHNLLSKISGLDMKYGLIKDFPTPGQVSLLTP